MNHIKSISITAILAAVIPLGLVSCASQRSASPPPANARQLTPKVAAENAVYAMMAENVYHRKKIDPYPLDKLGWLKIKPDGCPAQVGKPSYSNAMGLAVDIYHHEKEGRYAYVFRGTDSKQDWAISNLAAGIAFPYKSARKQFREFLYGYLEGNRKQVVVIGHSLGGGLAGSQSLNFGVDAIMFNTSPRVFDGLGDKWYEKKYPKKSKPSRIAIEQSGEILSKIRTRYPKYAAVMAGHPDYYCDANKGDHSMTVLAQDILDLAAKKNPAFVPFRDMKRSAATP